MNRAQGQALAPTFGWDVMREYRGWVPGAPDIPMRAVFVEPGMRGERLTLGGRVLSALGAPLADVKLEFWQADADGIYDLDGYRLRGIQRSDAAGRYRLETIVPGNAGSLPHINFIATAQVPGRKQPRHLRAAIWLATEKELDAEIPDTERPFVRPGATTRRQDPAFLALTKLRRRGGVRQAAYDIVLDIG